MELDDLSLDLGFRPQHFVAEPNSSPLESDSDYSSVGNDVDSCSLLYSDVGLYNAVNSNDDFSLCDGTEIGPLSSPDDFFTDDLISVEMKPQADHQTLKNKSPAVITVKSEQTSESDLSISRANITTLNQHNYALPVNEQGTGKAVAPVIDIRKIISSSKLLSQPESDKKLAAISLRIINSPSFASGTEKLFSPKCLNIENNPMTKNAIAARENRQKKKQYIQSLEGTVKDLKNENGELREQISELSSSVTEMSNELKYLRSVLYNVQEISSLVKGIKTLPRFQGETNRKRRQSVAGLEQTVLSKKCRNVTPCSLPSKVFSGPSEASSLETPGICVHVKGSSISLELCHHCSKQASVIGE